MTSRNHQGLNQFEAFNNRIAEYQKVVGALEQIMVPIQALEKSMAPVRALENAMAPLKALDAYHSAASIRVWDRLAKLQAPLSSALQAHAASNELNVRLQKLSEMMTYNHSAIAFHQFKALSRSLDNSHVFNRLAKVYSDLSFLNSHRSQSFAHIKKLSTFQDLFPNGLPLEEALDVTEPGAASILADTDLNSVMQELDNRASEYESDPKNWDTSTIYERTGGKSITDVSTQTLLIFLNIFILILTLLSNIQDAKNAVVSINAQLPVTESFSEMREYVWKTMAGKPGDARMVTGNNVNLREGPSMKSAVILPVKKNSIVVVIGKEDRNWLQVVYEHEGYTVIGYVSTKFLKKFRK
ncbi:SH3 domain-containing protein [Herminiimonas contaminans]|uniref:SH3 domain-containing protein n=1 Tax=Herminiimonas contaminans TaxID=1111140 RepID=A0ABS0EZ59_9BURK|nr:SH3 domain-containing protein [Herminiimonas contaminans]MBF8179713.1 SH3 domain-containing protein [Herminiimonas contaminans]